jgi:FkbM family methyltransferase
MYLLENRHIGVKRCKHGIFAYNRNDTFIGKSLDQYGEWCEFEIDLLRNFLKPGDRVIDVGANIGTHTIAFANIVGPTGKVIAFEPQPELFGLLVTNVTLNCLTNVRAEQFAVVGNNNSEIEIHRLPPPDTAFNFGAQHLLGANTTPLVRVRCSSIDGRGLSPGPALIKIDVEGMESDVIRGAVDTIMTHRPVLYVENNGNDSQALWAALEPIGYVGYWSIGPYFSKTNFFGSTTNLWASVMPSVNVIAFPEAPAVAPAFSLLPKMVGPDDSWQKAIDRTPQLRRFL